MDRIRLDINIFVVAASVQRNATDILQESSNREQPNFKILMNRLEIDFMEKRMEDYNQLLAPHFHN